MKNPSLRSKGHFAIACSYNLYNLKKVLLLWLYPHYHVVVVITTRPTLATTNITYPTMVGTGARSSFAQGNVCIVASSSPINDGSSSPIFSKRHLADIKEYTTVVLYILGPISNMSSCNSRYFSIRLLKKKKWLQKATNQLLKLAPLQSSVLLASSLLHHGV